MNFANVSPDDATWPETDLEEEFIRWVAVWLNSARILCTQPKGTALPGHAKHCLQEARKAAELIHTTDTRRRANELIRIVAAEVARYQESR